LERGKQMKKATKAKEVLLYLGIYITIFLLSSGLVGYGIQNHLVKSGWWYIDPIFDLKVVTVWILGIFGMIFGLLGITNVIKTLFIRKSRKSRQSKLSYLFS